MGVEITNPPIPQIFTMVIALLGRASHPKSNNIKQSYNPGSSMCVVELFGGGGRFQ